MSGEFARWFCSSRQQTHNTWLASLQLPNQGEKQSFDVLNLEIKTIQRCKQWIDQICAHFFSADKRQWNVLVYETVISSDEYVHNVGCGASLGGIDVCGKMLHANESVSFEVSIWCENQRTSKRMLCRLALLKITVLTNTITEGKFMLVLPGARINTAEIF